MRLALVLLLSVTVLVESAAAECAWVLWEAKEDVLWEAKDNGANSHLDTWTILRRYEDSQHERPPAVVAPSWDPVTVT